MNNSDPFHILLAHPPVTSPAIPPWALARAAACLSGTGLSLERYDANLDFFLNHILTTERLTSLVALIKKRARQGEFEEADPYAVSLLADLCENTEQWNQEIADVGNSLEILRTEDFYRPETCLNALKDIGDLLALASLAFGPSRIQWGRFSNPAIRDWSQISRFVEDQNTNPFLSLCKEGLAPRLVSSRLRLLILFVSAPDQMLAALTMARFCKKQHIGLHVVLLSDNLAFEDASDYVDNLLPETDLIPLLDLVAELGGSPVQGDVTGPDFSGLPLKGYLSPAVVLPFKGTLGSCSDSMPPSALLAVLADQVNCHGAEAFLSKDYRLTPAYMAEMAGEHQSFCLGLACVLDTSSGPEEMAAAHRAGVKLVEWRDPAGQLESLAKILWDASRAGLWNHVVIPAGTDSSLAQELVRFMAANSSIAHSWIRQHTSTSLFGSAAEQDEETSADYGQVARLPGQPLWQRLNDPVYLLLYLKRYGLKKVMRWRVRDDGNSVYALGRDMVYHFVKPGELPPGYLDEICRMVEAGGSVGTKWVRYNLERAFLIGYVLEGGVIVGNSSLKLPRPEYVEAVSKQSGLDLSQYLERGYTSVRPEYRGMGIGTKLLEGLTARAGHRKIFSVISDDNVATKKIAIRNRTRQVASFYSERIGKQMGIWMPEWMIED